MIEIRKYCASNASAVHPHIQALQGSMILQIAGQVRKLKAEGKDICNLTVGDFDPQYFPIPEELAEEVHKAYREGNTNYPPSDGVMELREAVDELYQRKFGLQYGTAGVCVASGARPPLYATYVMYVGQGEGSVSFLPSWNNSYYAHLQQANHQFIATNAQSNFHPTVEQVEQVLPDVQLLALNTPLNPTGTVMSKDVLEGITKAVVLENEKRKSQQRRPVMIMFDQVYWMLLANGQEHQSPVQLVPESAPYVVHIDAISKCFASTGLRVGWAVLPPSEQVKMKDVIGHIGAWAAKPEQVATARFLRNPGAIDTYMATMNDQINQRLQVLYTGIMSLKAKGYPVDAIAPQGAIYLSFYVGLISDKFPTNEAIRNFLLEKIGVAVVPFQAFDMMSDNGWFRISVGACGVQDLHAALARMETVLATL